jgi:MFS family permease
MPSAGFWRAWSIWAISVAGYVTTLGYTAVHPLPPAVAANFGATGLDNVVGGVFLLAFASVGSFLAWKRPGNPIGWLLSATCLAYAAGGSGTLLAHFPRALPVANWLGWFFLAGLGLCVYVVLLFPGGHLPSRRWRPVAWLAGAGLGLWALGNAFEPTITTVSPQMRNPFGVAAPAGDIFKVMVIGGAVLLAGMSLAAVLSVALRYRHAQTGERAQLKWLVYAGAVVVVAVLTSLGPVAWIMGPDSATSDVQNAMVSSAVALVPVAIGIAVMRYRLYDIDRVVSRTVSYAIVTGLLVGVYAGLVLLATGVLGFHTSVAVAVATLAAAALFSPVRRLVQHKVDRRFNRTRYDADETLAAFAARLKDAVDLDTVRGELASVVQTALEPTRLSLWTSEPH